MILSVVWTTTGLMRMAVMAATTPTATTASSVPITSPLQSSSFAEETTLPPSVASSYSSSFQSAKPVPKQQPQQEHEKEEEDDDDDELQLEEPNKAPSSSASAASLLTRAPHSKRPTFHDNDQDDDDETTRDPSLHHKTTTLSDTSLSSSSSSLPSPLPSQSSSPPLLIVCLVDGSLYALNAWTGELQSSYEAGPPLVQQPQSQQQTSQSPQSLDDGEQQEQDWEPPPQQEHDEEDWEDDEEFWNWDSWDYQMEDDNNDNIHLEDNPNHHQQEQDEDPIHDSTTTTTTTTSDALRIHPGLDGQLYYWQPASHHHSNHDHDNDQHDNDGVLQPLPLSMSSLLEHPVQTCSSTTTSHKKECGILTASVAQTTLLAVDATTGALQWTSHSHSPSNGNGSPVNPPVWKDDDSSAPAAVLLLQRKDLVVQHVSLATGQCLWNVTVGSYQAIDFSAANENAPRTSSSASHVPLLKFAKGGRALYALAAAPEEENDEAFKVLWKIESPHVVASVFGMNRQQWQPIQVLQEDDDDEEEEEKDKPNTPPQDKNDQWNEAFTKGPWTRFLPASSSSSFSSSSSSLFSSSWMDSWRQEQQQQQGRSQPLLSLPAGEPQQERSGDSHHTQDSTSPLNKVNHNNNNNEPQPDADPLHYYHFQPGHCRNGATGNTCLSSFATSPPSVSPPITTPFSTTTIVQQQQQQDEQWMQATRRGIVLVAHLLVLVGGVLLWKRRRGRRQRLQSTTTHHTSAPGIRSVSLEASSLAESSSLPNGASSSISFPGAIPTRSKNNQHIPPTSEAEALMMDDPQGNSGTVPEPPESQNRAQATSSDASAASTTPKPPSVDQENVPARPAAATAVIPHPTGEGTSTVPLVQYARYASEFEELESLGQGGFGSVVRCRNKLDGRDYAIKKVMLRGPVQSSSEQQQQQPAWAAATRNAQWRFQQELARVLREVKILAVLDHPNIVRYFTAWLEMDVESSSSTTTCSEQPPGSNRSKDPNEELNSSRFEQDLSSVLSSRQPGTGETPSHQASSSMWRSRLGGRWGPSNANTPSWTTNDESSLRYRPNNNSYSTTAAWEDQQRAAAAIAASLGDAAEECGIIFEDSSRCTGGGEGDRDTGVGNDEKASVLSSCHKRLAYHHHRSEQLSDSMDASSGVEEEASKHQARSNDTTPQVVNDTETTPIVQHTLYIQMQLCRFETIADFLRNKEARKGRTASRRRRRSSSSHNKVDIPLALSLLLQIAKAVQHVHEKGLIHRDLKPSNCFMDTLGVVKVGDFGLSRETHNSASLTMTDQDDNDELANRETTDAAIVAQLFGDAQVSPTNDDDESAAGAAAAAPPTIDHTAGVGTRLYASPEQTEGSSYDSSTDVYSLGIMLYELCYPMYTGMERNICLSKLRQQRQFPLDWSTVVGRPYSQPIQDLVQSMLDPRPSLRPNAAQVALQIQQIMGELTILSPLTRRKTSSLADDEQQNGESNTPGSNDHEEDDDDVVFLKVESQNPETALPHAITLIQSWPHSGDASQRQRPRVEILQSGMARQVSTGTTILEFALVFHHHHNNRRLWLDPEKHTETTSLKQQHDVPIGAEEEEEEEALEEYLVRFLEQDSDIVRVQAISAHHPHPSQPPPKPDTVVA